MGALMLGFTTFEVVFLANVVTFLWSTALVAGVRVPVRETARAAAAVPVDEPADGGDHAEHAGPGMVDGGIPGGREHVVQDRGQQFDGPLLRGAVGVRAVDRQAVTQQHRQLREGEQEGGMGLEVPGTGGFYRKTFQASEAGERGGAGESQRGANGRTVAAWCLLWDEPERVAPQIGQFVGWS